MTTTPTEALARVALGQIVPSLTNPRKTFDATKLAELAESIKASGVHQPVLLRPLPAGRVEDTAHMTPRPAYELVCGERRLRASEMAGAADIPALVRAMSDADALEAQVIENLQRDDLQPLEEAEGYQALMQRHEPPMSADEVAAKIGKSKAYVYARLKLLDLGPEGQQALQAGKLDPSRALLIARIPSAKLQAEAIKAITDWNGNPRSYRESANIVHDRFMLRLSSAKFKITDATLVADAGSCRACPKRTGANPELFGDVDGADVCTDPPCFRAKEAAHSEAQLKAARENGATIIEGREAKALMPHSYTDRVDGFLRLDSAEDSPTGKPLRALIGKQMDKQGITPTLVANPHRDGELVAVIDHATAQQLLAAKGYEDQAAKLAEKAQQSERAAAEDAKRKAKEKFEAAWRWALLERTWQSIEAADESHQVLTDAAMRHLAMRYVENINQDRAKRLCKLLDLGKVAPVQGIKDWVDAYPDAERALALVMMNAEVEHEPWRMDPARANKALMLIATDREIDIEAVKAEVKKEHTAAARAAAKKAEAQAEAQAARAAEATGPSAGAEGSDPLPSAAPAKGVRGKAGAKTAGKPKAPAPKKPRLSAQDAQAGIAAAMQSQEAGADAGPGGTDPAGASAGEPDEQRPTAAAEGGQQIDVGSRVEVRASPGSQGTVTKAARARDSYTVTLDHSTGDYIYTRRELVLLPSINAWPFPNSANSTTTTTTTTAEAQAEGAQA